MIPTQVEVNHADLKQLQVICNLNSVRSDVKEVMERGTPSIQTRSSSRRSSGSRTEYVLVGLDAEVETGIEEQG